jgi:hypothetical protein
VLDEVNDPGAVPRLVIVPAHELDKVVREGNPGLLVEDGRVRARDEVGRHNILVLVAQDPLHAALRGGLDGGADVAVRGSLFEAGRQVDHAHVNGGNTEADGATQNVSRSPTDRWIHTVQLQS